MEQIAVMINSNRLKLRLCFLILVIIAGSSCVGQSSSEGKLAFIEKNSTLILSYSKNDQEKKLYEFSSIPSYQKRISIFKNGNIIGFLPTYNETLKIQRWNDLGHDFTLFFADRKNGNIIIYRRDLGWNFHINETGLDDSKIISITRTGESEIMFMNNGGEIIKNFKFESPFNPDVIKVVDINESNADIEFSILGKKAIFQLIFQDNSVKLIDVIKTVEGK